MLTVENLSVTLAGRPLLRDIAMTARPGTLTAIIGPNGSGKTTLLRALTGEVAFTGNVRLNGLDPARAPAHRLAAIRAVLAQSTQVAFPFTVEEIVRLGLESGSGPAAPGLPAQLLAELDLAGYGPRSYHQLSGGEQSRVQFARVLAQARQTVTPDGPSWLFLDEPVASLDLAHQTLAIRLARRFADSGGGVVMVMHDLNLTAMVADQVVLLRAGQVQAAGPVEEVFADATLSRAYACGIRVNHVPDRGPWLLPQSLREVEASGAGGL